MLLFATLLLLLPPPLPGWLAGWLPIYLPCHYCRQLHLTTRKHRSENVEAKSAGAGGERGVLEELQEVEDYNEYGYVCVFAFPVLLSARLRIERMEKAGWLAG